MPLKGIQNARLDEIVVAIRDRLISKIPDAGTDTVKITASPDIRTGPSEYILFNVTPAPRAEYDDAAMDGGGELQLTTSMIIVITAHLPDTLDAPKEIEEWWTQSSNVNQIRRQILRALVQFNPLSQRTGIVMLNDPMLPTQFSWTKAKTHGDLQLAFTINFDEDIYDGADVVDTDDPLVPPSI